MVGIAGFKTNTKTFVAESGAQNIIRIDAVFLIGHLFECLKGCLIFSILEGLAHPQYLLRNSRKTDSLRLMEATGSSKYWSRAEAAFALLKEQAQNGAPMARNFAGSSNIWRPSHRALCAPK